MIQLTPGEVHVFELGLETPVDSCLDETEGQRAARFVFPRDRRRFTAAHTQVREILGSLLQRPPRSLQFQVAARGKPFVEGLEFNLSHSADRALLAVHGHLPVGVDVEAMRPDVEFRGIARRSFSSAEQSALCTAPDLSVAFYRVWTQKEAFIKLVGEGLAFPLDAFDVSLRPEGGLDACRERVDASHVWLRTLPAPSGFAAALAVEGPAQRLCRWRYAAGKLEPVE